MYTPAHFDETRLPVLHEAIRQARLAALVTLSGDGIEASHTPVLLEPTEGAYGTIYGHLSRANPQWRRASAAVPALAIFSGPDAYVTPSWYPTKEQTGRAVPTWNYVAVHAYGGIEFFEDSQRLRRVVTALTENHEARRAEPWSISDAPEDYIDAMLRGIVGFRLAIGRLEGKWKMSQNRSADDRQGVIDGLKEAGGTSELAVAQVMSRSL